jgi:hypothetical protein
VEEHSRNQRQLLCIQVHSFIAFLAQILHANLLHKANMISADKDIVPRSAAPISNGNGMAGKKTPNPSSQHQKYTHLKAYADASILALASAKPMGYSGRRLKVIQIGAGSVKS